MKDPPEIRRLLQSGPAVVWLDWGTRVAEPCSPSYFNGLTLTPGSRLGVFQLIDLIGRGGMGEVYRARDTQLDRRRGRAIPATASAHDLDEEEKCGQ